MINADDLQVYDLIAILMRTKLSESSKSLVIQARTSLQQHGRIPVRIIGRLRMIYTRHSRQIREREQARERGRISLAKKSRNLGDEHVREIRRCRIRRLEESVSDLGI